MVEVSDTADLIAIHAAKFISAASSDQRVSVQHAWSPDRSGRARSAVATTVAGYRPPQLMGC